MNIHEEIKIQLETQINNLEILLNDITYKQTQQTLSKIWKSYKDSKHKVKELHKNYSDLKELELKMASPVPCDVQNEYKRQTIQDKNDYKPFFEVYSSVEEYYKQNAAKLRSKIEILEAQLPQTKLLENEQELITLISSTNNKLLNITTIKPLKEIVANYIVTKPELYNTVLQTMPADVLNLLNEAQQFATIKKHLVRLRINFLLTKNIEKIKETINAFISHNDLPPVDKIFINAIIFGDATSTHRILKSIEPRELKRITDYVEKTGYNKRLSIQGKITLELADYVETGCNKNLPKPGKALKIENHPFYARVIWLFSKYFIENINQLPEISFRSEWDYFCDWDRPFTYQQHGNHLWKIGNIVFDIFFSVLPKTIPIKKLILQIACMYDRVDMVKFYCEQDPDQNIMIDYLCNHDLAVIAAEYINTKILDYLLTSNILELAQIEDTIKFYNLPDFLSKYCHNKPAGPTGQRYTEIEDERIDLINFVHKNELMKLAISHQQKQIEQLQLSLQQKQQQIDELLKQQTGHTSVTLSSDQTYTKRAAEDDIESDTNKKPKMNPRELGQDSKTGDNLNQIMQAPKQNMINLPSNQESKFGNNSNLLLPSPKQNNTKNPTHKLSENALLKISNINKNRG